MVRSFATLKYAVSIEAMGYMLATAAAMEMAEQQQGNALGNVEQPCWTKTWAAAAAALRSGSGRNMGSGIRCSHCGSNIAGVRPGTCRSGYRYSGRTSCHPCSCPPMSMRSSSTSAAITVVCLLSSCHGLTEPRLSQRSSWARVCSQL